MIYLFKLDTDTHTFENYIDLGVPRYISIYI